MLKIFAFITMVLSALALLIAAFSLDLGTTIFALSGILIGALTLNQQETLDQLHKLESQIREIPKRQPPPTSPQQWDVEDVTVGGKSKAFDFLSDSDADPSSAASHENVGDGGEHHELDKHDELGKHDQTDAPDAEDESDRF
ncbi:MAG: hypothetical protein NXI04_24040 [Planctomycetaceae bacterium]|nr:hypothetical protein [Planctomycetaceae bacterium]